MARLVGSRHQLGDTAGQASDDATVLSVGLPLRSQLLQKQCDGLVLGGFVSTGLDIPKDLQEVPRTIFADPEKPHLDKFYDQIAWFTGRNGLPALSLRYSRGGFFGFTKSALTTRGLTKTQLSWHISDHYPLWAEFSTRD